MTNARRLETEADEPERSQIRLRYQLIREVRRPRLDLGAVPYRLIDNRALLALPIDSRAAFVISQIDGNTPLRSLVDVTGVVADELVALVERLVDLKAVAIR